MEPPPPRVSHCRVIHKGDLVSSVQTFLISTPSTPPTPTSLIFLSFFDGHPESNWTTHLTQTNANIQWSLLCFLTVLHVPCCCIPTMLPSQLHCAWTQRYTHTHTPSLPSPPNVIWDIYSDEVLCTVTLRCFLCMVSCVGLNQKPKGWICFSRAKEYTHTAVDEGEGRVNPAVVQGCQTFDPHLISLS